MSAVFITGAGTDVGKTYIACALIRALRAGGVEVEAIKPVVSGYLGADRLTSDPARLIEATGAAVCGDEIDRVSPWRYAASLAPNMAARLEGRRVCFDAVRAYAADRAAKSAGILIIEGVGGVMSPVSDEQTNLDLIVALKTPVVLVCGAYLGAISHALTALEVVRRRTDVLAVVISESRGGVDLDETVDSVRRHCGSIPAIAAPRDAAFGRSGAALSLVRTIAAGARPVSVDR